MCNHIIYDQFPEIMGPIKKCSKSRLEIWGLDNPSIQLQPHSAIAGNHNIALGLLPPVSDDKIKIQDTQKNSNFGQPVLQTTKVHC